VFDSGLDEEDTPYLVMELLQGENLDLRQTRRGGRLPVREVLWVADQTLAVLVAAHAKGIVHRDLKPENLFLTADRSLKVLDFGIARLADRPGTKTTSGSVLGTLAFMAPEQARGANGEVGEASDLWAMGATMFTLLSGRFVRDGDNAFKVLLKAGADKVPSIRHVAPDLPAELIELVDAALLFDARVRWPTAKAMRSAVRMVSAKLKHQHADVIGGDGEDAEDVPSGHFSGLLAVRSITPPPPSSVAGGSEPLGIAPLALPWVGDEGPRSEALDAPAAASVQTATSPSDSTGTSAPAAASTLATTSASPARAVAVLAKPEPLAPSAVGDKRRYVRVPWLAIGVALLVFIGWIAFRLAFR
jgi:serine/threonine-protein kinase